MKLPNIGCFPLRRSPLIEVSSNDSFPREFLRLICSLEVPLFVPSVGKYKCLKFSNGTSKVPLFVSSRKPVSVDEENLTGVESPF